MERRWTSSLFFLIWPEFFKSAKCPVDLGGMLGEKACLCDARDAGLSLAPMGSSLRAANRIIESNI